MKAQKGDVRRWSSPRVAETTGPRLTQGSRAQSLSTLSGEATVSTTSPGEARGPEQQESAVLLEGPTLPSALLSSLTFTVSPK